LLSEDRGNIPHHARVYRDFAGERDRLQQERITAYQEYIIDVEGKSYPATEHDVSIEQDEFKRFLGAISNTEKD